jgi:hypothetical protein
MKYFNIRYECNDARDDYSTQLKKGDGVFPQWMTSDTLDDLDDIDPMIKVVTLKMVNMRIKTMAKASMLDLVEMESSNKMKWKP